MMIDGSVINRIPHIIAGNEISFPINVVGTISPYPVVVIVTITNQNAAGILSKVLGLLFASTNTCRASSHSPNYNQNEYRTVTDDDTVSNLAADPSFALPRSAKYSNVE